MAIKEAVYTAHATVIGGRREGTAKTSDGRLEVNLSTPKAMGGDDGPGTNPEQLFAAGYAACFIGALKAVGGKMKLAVPKDTRIDSAVSFGELVREEPGYGIQVSMKIHLPGLGREQAEALVKAAHRVCPYSNATRDNVDVKLEVVEA